MTGLIGPDLRREDCRSGPSHDDWRKTCLMEFLPKNLAYPTDGRVKGRLPHLSRAAYEFWVLPAPHAVPPPVAFFLLELRERTRHGRLSLRKMLTLMRIDQFRGGGLPDPENAFASRPYRGCDELRIVRAHAQLFPACARRIY